MLAGDHLAGARAIGNVDVAPVRMHVHGARLLRTVVMRRIGQRAGDVERRRTQHLAIEIPDLQFVLALERNIQARQCRMKIDVSRPETITIAGRNARPVRQQPLPVVEQFERPRVFGLAGFGIVAARHHDRACVRRREAHLVRIDAEIKRCRLRDLGTDSAIGIEAMHAHAARHVIGDRHML